MEGWEAILFSDLVPREQQSGLLWTNVAETDRGIFWDRGIQEGIQKRRRASQTAARTGDGSMLAGYRWFLEATRGGEKRWYAIGSVWEASFHTRSVADESWRCSMFTTRSCLPHCSTPSRRCLRLYRPGGSLSCLSLSSTSRDLFQVSRHWLATTPHYLI